MADPVFTALAAALATTDPAPDAVFADPSEAVAVANFPCFILIHQTNTDHIWRTIAHNETQPNYGITAHLLLGSMKTPLPQLHAMSVPSIWPKAVNKVIARDITLGGVVQAVGNGTEFFRYRVAPVKWGDGLYWGIKFMFPIKEYEIEAEDL